MSISTEDVRVMAWAFREPASVKLKPCLRLPRRNVIQKNEYHLCLAYKKVKPSNQDSFHYIGCHFFKFCSNIIWFQGKTYSGVVEKVNNDKYALKTDALGLSDIDHIPTYSVSKALSKRCALNCILLLSSGNVGHIIQDYIIQTIIITIVLIYSQSGVPSNETFFICKHEQHGLLPATIAYFHNQIQFVVGFTCYWECFCLKML